jgi:hypothetical protein
MIKAMRYSIQQFNKQTEFVLTTVKSTLHTKGKRVERKIKFTLCISIPISEILVFLAELMSTIQFMLLWGTRGKVCRLNLVRAWGMGTKLSSSLRCSFCVFLCGDPSEPDKTFPFELWLLQLLSIQVWELNMVFELLIYLIHHWIDFGFCKDWILMRIWSCGCH